MNGNHRKYVIAVARRLPLTASGYRAWMLAQSSPKRAEQGIAAEAVASRAAKVAARLLAQESAAVEPHLADQLLLPMALAGEGSFTTLALTPHATTNIDIIRRFLDVPIAVSEAGFDLCTVRIGNR